MKLPRDIGPVHFVGIGGIGMSGIAEVLANLGYSVTGSDVADSANVKRLRDKGVKVAIGHKAENIDGADVVVISSAIKRDNPELVAARARRLPVVRRAEMLAELMRLKSCIAVAGTHGKTTTTSLVASLLDAGGLDPTVINGGIINAYGTNARLGAGDWMVVEADESDGTFLKLPADIAIVTNIDPEHLDHFRTFEAVQDAFRGFVENVPFYGFAVMCTDHPVVQTMVGKLEDCRVLTYGENPQADVRLVDLDHLNGESRFSVLFRDRDGKSAHKIDKLTLPMPGRHNALNATAAIAVAHALGVKAEVIRKALAGFGGVKRRFTRVGEWNGATIIDDYAHHPVDWYVRMLGKLGEPEWRTVFYFALSGTVLGLIGTVIGGFSPHDARGLALLIGVGVTATLAQLAMTRAYAYGHTLVVANLQFAAVVAASLIGIAAFGDHIPLVGWIGIATIIVSGVASTVLIAHQRVTVTTGRSETNPPRE